MTYCSYTDRSLLGVRFSRLVKFGKTMISFEMNANSIPVYIIIGIQNTMCAVACVGVRACACLSC